MKFSKAVIDKALNERPWINKRSADRYRVVPRRQRDGKIEHGKYECRVEWDSEGMPTVTECREYRRNQPCQGFTFAHQCYHSAALTIHLLKGRQQKRKAA